MTPAEQLLPRGALTEPRSQPSPHIVERLVIISYLSVEKEERISLSDQPSGKRGQVRNIPLVRQLIRVAQVATVVLGHRVDADRRPATGRHLCRRVAEPVFQRQAVGYFDVTAAT